jgi:uncharacterized protein
MPLRYYAAVMSKQHYFVKLIPPRATFPMDITEAERAVMEEHSAYFRRQFDAGNVLIYGPVMPKDGAFGVAILEVTDEPEASLIMKNDPSVRAGVNRFELSPMRVPVSRAKSE